MPEPRPARQQAIVRVFLALLGRDGGRLPVGRRLDEQPEESLDVPARFAEFDGQPVEQLGMRRQLAGDAEVAGGAHQAGAEDLLPEAVDRHAGGQGMLGPDQPSCQPEPVPGQVGRHGRQGVGRVGLHRVAALVVLAAVEQIRHRRLGALVHHVRQRAPPANRGVFGIEGRAACA